MIQKLLQVLFFIGFVGLLAFGVMTLIAVSGRDVTAAGPATAAPGYVQPITGNEVWRPQAWKLNIDGIEYLIVKVGGADSGVAVLRHQP